MIPKAFSVIFTAPKGSVASLGYAPVDVIFEYYDFNSGEWLALAATVIGVNPDYLFKVDVPAGTNGVLIRSGFSAGNEYTSYPSNFAENLTGIPVGRVPYVFTELTK